MATIDAGSGTVFALSSVPGVLRGADEVADSVFSGAPNVLRGQAGIDFDLIYGVELGSSVVIDVVEPDVDNFSPVIPSSIDQDTTIQFDVTDNADDLEVVTVYVTYGATGIAELVHNGSAFGPAFSVGSTRTPTANGYTYSIKRDDDWIADPQFTVVAVDGDGNSHTEVFGWTLNPGEGTGIGDPQEPQITNVTPALLSTITPSTEIAFDLTDNDTLTMTVIMVRYSPTDNYQVIWDGTAFASDYDANSTRTPIAGGFRYSLRHDAGWPNSPTIRVAAVDRNANLATLNLS